LRRVSEKRRTPALKQLRVSFDHLVGERSVSCCLLDTRGAESTANHSAQPGKLRLVIIMRLTKKGEN
jgi:hypothetical protein